MKVDFDASRPIYQQVIAEIRKAVARGELKPGSKIPSQREMAQILRVNPNTIQRAYREMEQSALVETLRGQGTFIKDNPSLFREIRREMTEEALNHFLDEMHSLGFSDEEILSLIEEKMKERSSAVERGLSPSE